MLAMARRMAFFAAVACIFSYATLVVAASSIRTEADEAIRTVWVRDVATSSTHYMSGIVMTPSTCSELHVRVSQVSTSVYKLSFTTWDNPSIPCTRELTPRPFRTVVFGPLIGLRFISTLNDQPLPILVIPSEPKKQQ